MQKLIDLLRKIGVLRFGSYSGTFKNATEMPDEMVTDTFNAEKELVTSADFKNFKSNPLLLVALILAVFFFILFLSNGLFKFWILIGIVFWVIFILKIKSGSISSLKCTVLLALLVIISFIIVGNVDDKSAGSKEVVDKRVVKVTSEDGELTGSVGIEEYKGGKIKAIYNIRVVTDLATNWVCLPELAACGDSYNIYTYIGDLVEQDDVGDAEGAFSSEYCNKDAEVSDPYDVGGVNYGGTACLNIKNGLDMPTTETFSASFSTWFDEYDEFLSTNEYNVHDGSKFWYVSDRGVSDDGATHINHSVDGDRAVTESSPIKSYTLIFN